MLLLMVTPPVTATLVPQVSGVLVEVLFTEGQAVKKGQVLARIDPRSYEQALAQARAQTARDEAQLAAVLVANVDITFAVAEGVVVGV